MGIVDTVLSSLGRYGHIKKRIAEQLNDKGFVILEDIMEEFKHDDLTRPDYVKRFREVVEDAQAEIIEEHNLYGAYYPWFFTRRLEDSRDLLTKLMSPLEEREVKDTIKEHFRVDRANIIDGIFRNFINTKYLREHNGKFIPDRDKLQIEEREWITLASEVCLSKGICRRDELTAITGIGGKTQLDEEARRRKFSSSGDYFFDLPTIQKKYFEPPIKEIMEDVSLSDEDKDIARVVAVSRLADYLKTDESTARAICEGLVEIKVLSGVTKDPNRIYYTFGEIDLKRLLTVSIKEKEKVIKDFEEENRSLDKKMNKRVTRLESEKELAKQLERQHRRYNQELANDTYTLRTTRELIGE